jgi:predicted Zn-dependent protease
MILNESQARQILERALSFSTADEAEAILHESSSANLRFAENIPTTNGLEHGDRISITSVFGRRSGTYATTSLDDESLRNAVAKSEELARLAPENLEYMPRLGPQEYLHSPAWDETTAELEATERTGIAGHSIAEAEKEGLKAAGYYVGGRDILAVANTRGLFGYFRATSASYTLTVRSDAGTGSGWAAAESWRSSDVDGASITRRAVEKALASRQPVPLEAGTYPVVLEPSAAGDMLGTFFRNLDRRAADEGRSYFSTPGGGTKIGEKLFSELVTISSYPAHPQAPSIPWGEDAQPLGRTVWTEKGVQKELAVSRYWAQEKGLAPLPAGSNVIMEGGDYSLDDLVAATDYGILVTSLWYIRPIDPQKMIFTGLTRDGIFLIEKGKISHPVVNFRWNESPAALYGCVEMLSRAERVVTRESEMTILVPALKAREFHFTSISPST